MREFEVFDKRLNSYVRGKNGVERKENEVTIYADDIAVFYGFSTVARDRLTIKFCNKIIKAIRTGTAFNSVGMYFYEFKEERRITKTPENMVKLYTLIKTLENMPDECTYITCGECLHFKEKPWPHCSEGKIPSDCTHAFDNVYLKILELFGF